MDQLYVETRELRLQGFLLFLVSDCVLFSSFIFAYLYLRNSGQGWPPPGIHATRRGVCGVELGRAVRVGRDDALRAGELEARQLHEVHVVADLRRSSSARASSAARPTSTPPDLRRARDLVGGSGIFGASFFTLTGMHGFHVFIGVCYLTVLLLQSAAGVYTRSKYFGITAGTLYWHFVDVIWVAALLDLLLNLRSRT